jgi:hypothetical protein
MVRAKMYLSSVTDYGTNSSKVLRFQCSYDMSIPEDQRFCKATPSGSAEFYIDNPGALAQFQKPDGSWRIGEAFYVDFTPCVVEQAATAAGTPSATP